MSRLDDELKVAFQRQEPSADFAARVMARINEAPAPADRARLWQRLAGWFARPVPGYTVAGAMALLLIIIGLSLLRSQRVAGDEGKRLQVAVSADAPASQTPSPGGLTPDRRGPGRAESATPFDGLNSSTHSATAGTHTEPSARTGAGRQPSHHYVPVVARQTPPSAEAEAAKEKVLFALQITSETLNDAQRAISDDRPKDEKPEPVQNR
jgi:hypothetical protein